MSGYPAVYLDILTERQNTALSRLAPAFSDTDFYLAGGTALALQIGHRPSIDFDWFISSLGEPELLFRRLNAFNIEYNVISVDVQTVYITIDAVQVSFIGYKYPLLQPLIVLPEKNIKMAGTDDIACMKLSAIASRGSRKDFIDLHFLISAFRSLRDYLRLYIAKFQHHDIGHIIRGLVYFRDAEAEPDIRTEKPLNWEQLKSDFEKWVKELPAERLID